MFNIEDLAMLPDVDINMVAGGFFDTESTREL
jgi:hypothetical protein